MPNYCENVVLFRSHDSAIINKLHDAVCERRLFGFIKPEPKHESLDAETQWRDRKSTRLNFSHVSESRMPSSA